MKISKKKIDLAEHVARLLSYIPTVMYIGVSGSLAMENAPTNADIDIFVITKKNTLWITRCMLVLLLQIKRLRRKRNTKNSSGVVCLNMLIDTGHLSFPKNRRDIYTAHEIVQMKPLFSRGFTYEKFLKSNEWVQKMLPHAYPKTALQHIDIPKSVSHSFLETVDPLFEFLQKIYMQSHVTTETITKGFVAFHPYDYKTVVLEKWEERKKAYDI